MKKLNKQKILKYPSGKLAFVLGNLTIEYKNESPILEPADDVEEKEFRKLLTSPKKYEFKERRVVDRKEKTAVFETK